MFIFRKIILYIQPDMLRVSSTSVNLLNWIGVYVGVYVFV